MDDRGPRDRWTSHALGLAISLDELAIGFSLGLLGLPVVVVVVWLGIQAFVAAQLGCGSVRGSAKSFAREASGWPASF